MVSHTAKSSQYPQARQIPCLYNHALDLREEVEVLREKVWLRDQLIEGYQRREEFRSFAERRRKNLQELFGESAR